MPLALAFGTTLTLCLAFEGAARADGLLGPHVMPGFAPAYDFTTGQQYQAPPVPYGHYAKGLMGESGHSKGCLSCLMGGSGLFHKGHGSGCGSGDCGSSGGCGHGWFGNGHDSPCSEGVGCGFLSKHHKSSVPCGAVMATGQAPSGQALVQPSGQSICGQPGCKIGQKHGHMGNLLSKLSCGSCGGRGCGACGGMGNEGMGKGCGLCGGRGCPSCLSGLKDSMRGKLSGMLHRQKIKWFLGAGGPVPITPGYVPYIVTTRSPRDFFAFAPMNPNAQ